MFVILGLFMGKLVLIMCLKAPRNYLDQFWSNKILVVLLEVPKPPNSMTSGFVAPGTLIYGFVAPGTLYFKKMQARIFWK